MQSEPTTIGAQQFIDYLQENPFAVLNLEGEERGSFGHHFTLGLSRFGLSELYIHLDEEDACRDLLMDLGDLHMVKRLEEGILTLPDYKDQNGFPLLFTVRYLKGPELFAAAEEFNAGFQNIFEEDYDRIYEHGICQIFWPDEGNTSVQMLKEIYDEGDRSDQDVIPVVIH